MGLTKYTASGLLAKSGLDVLPSSAFSIEDTDVGPGGMVQTGVVIVEVVPDMAREFAYGRPKWASGFLRVPVGRT